MIRIGLYAELMNADVKGYLGLYRGNTLTDYMRRNRNLYNLVNSFFDKAKDGQDMDYNEENMKIILELYHNLKVVKWAGNLLCFADDKQIEASGFTAIGYDICADSAHYSPIGDGFLTEYNKYPDFYADISFKKYSQYKGNINENWLFSSYEMAIDFSNYCNFINKKNLYCIESEDNWRPFAVYNYNR